MRFNLAPTLDLFSSMAPLDFSQICHPQASSGVASCSFLQDLYPPSEPAT